MVTGRKARRWLVRRQVIARRESSQDCNCPVRGVQLRSHRDSTPPNIESTNSEVPSRLASTAPHQRCSADAGWRRYRFADESVIPEEEGYPTQEQTSENPAVMAERRTDAYNASVATDGLATILIAEEGDSYPEDGGSPTQPVQQAAGIRYLYDEQVQSGKAVNVRASSILALDRPGAWTQTARVRGNAVGERGENGHASYGFVKLTSKWTCTGLGISGLSIGTGGVSVTGGADSKTLTWASERDNYRLVRQGYDAGGHFRCKFAIWGGFMKLTQRGLAEASFKDWDLRAEDSWSKTW